MQKCDYPRAHHLGSSHRTQHRRNQSRFPSSSPLKPQGSFLCQSLSLILYSIYQILVPTLESKTATLSPVTIASPSRADGTNTVSSSECRPRTSSFAASLASHQILQVSPLAAKCRRNLKRQDRKRHCNQHTVCYQKLLIYSRLYNIVVHHASLVIFIRNYLLVSLHW